MDGTFDLALLGDFAIALFIGALIGVERERKLEEHPLEFGGLRTFILISLAGALAAFLSQRFGTPWIYIAGLFAMVALVGAAYVAESRLMKHVPGLTGEIAAVVTWFLAGTVITGHRELAVMLAIVATALLTFKQDLHKVVHGLARDDVVAGLQLLFASFIVLPLLPNRTLDPWDALNPYKLWLLVVFISGLSLVGYAAVRILGERVGMTLTGLFGGLVSSTAVTLTFSRRSHEEGVQIGALAFGLLLAWTVMIPRVLLITSVIHPSLGWALLVPALAMLVVSGAALFVQWRRGPQESPGQVEFKNPFSLIAAIRFGALFAAVLLVVALARIYLPESWLYAVALAAGATDVDPIALTMSEQAGQGLDVSVAAFAVVLAMVSNTLVKGGMVAALGSRPLARTILGWGAAIASVGLIVGWIAL